MTDNELFRVRGVDSVAGAAVLLHQGFGMSPPLAGFTTILLLPGALPLG